MSDHKTTPFVSLPLRSLRLRPSMSVQVQRMRSPEVRQELQFLAAVTNKGVMIGPHGANAPQGAKPVQRMELSEGEDVVVRGFTG